MIAFHATVQCKPEKVEQFLEWKHDEAGVQRNAYGFIRSMVLQSTARPETFFYMSFWDRPDALVRLQENPAFVEVSRKYGVPMYAAAVRDGLAAQSAEDASRHPLLAAPVARFRCDVLIDERGRRHAAQSVDPYVFHYAAGSDPEHRDAYVAFKRAEAQLQLEAEGFIERLLLRRVDDPCGFYYISLWETSAAAHEFHDRFARSTEYAETYPHLHFAEAPEFEDCRLIQDVR